jgi:hypothetical protein
MTMESNDEVCLEVSIHVVQTTGLVDEQLEITVHGLCPFQAACLRAVMRDNGGREWASHGLFQADEDGRIDLSSQVPIEGSYSVADSMGLFWSTHLQASEVTPATPLAPLKTKLTVEVNEQAVATRNIVRHVVAPDVTRIPVRENGLVGTLFIPAGTGPHPGVIVLGGSEGGLMEGRAALLASHGFAALALAYFNKEHLPKQLVLIPVEYIGTAISFMESQPSVLPSKLAIYGISRGGELALLSAATYSQIRAVAAVVPSGVVFQGLKKSIHEEPSSSWSIDGIPVPFAVGEIQSNVWEEMRKQRVEGRPVSGLVLGTNEGPCFHRGSNDSR